MRKQWIRGAILAAVLALVGVAGCRSTETTDVEAGSMGAASQGAGGTGVGTRSTATQMNTPTGSSTQRGTGDAGPVTAPGPGQSGR